MTNRASKQPPVRQGETLAGKYRVESVIGQGAMGVVVAAMHMTLNERVALKFLINDPDPDVVSRFLREAQAAAKIKSDHIARVSDVGTLESGAPYIVMEYLDGLTLSALLRQRGPLPVAEAVDYLLQACDAIGEAHRLGIVHRDLKPANLFIERRPNGKSSLKVLDFGISKLPSEAGEANLTSTDQPLGTPLYMPPEQLKSARNADRRSDIWALGVILHELLAGVTPFKADSIAEIFSRILNENPKPLRSIRGDVPAEVEAVVLRALAKDPKARHQHIDEFTRYIAPFASNAPRRSDWGPPSAAPVAVAVLPSPPGAGFLSSPSLEAPSRPNGPAPLAQAALAAPGAAAALTLPSEPDRMGAGSGARAASAVSVRTVTNAPSSRLPIWIALALSLLVGGGIAVFIGMRGNVAAKPTPPVATPVETATPAPPAPSAEAVATTTATAQPSAPEPSEEPSAEPSAKVSADVVRRPGPFKKPPPRSDKSKPRPGVPDYGGRQ